MEGTLHLLLQIKRQALEGNGDNLPVAALDKDAAPVGGKRRLVDAPRYLEDEPVCVSVDRRVSPALTGNHNSLGLPRLARPQLKLAGDLGRHGDV